jgi:glyoxylase-like metal-dependent hydrolase (beta-lactamase superfamily II)
VRYLVNTHENFDHSSANDYFEKNGTILVGTDGCYRALEEDGTKNSLRWQADRRSYGRAFPD